MTAGSPSMDETKSRSLSSSSRKRSRSVFKITGMSPPRGRGMSLPKLRSIRGHRGVDVARPGQDPPFEVVQLLEPGLPELRDRAGGAGSRPAVHDGPPGRVELVEARGNLAQRDETRPRDPADRPLVRLADVDEVERLPGALELHDLLGSHLVGEGLPRALLTPPDAAEGRVVLKLRDRLFLAAEGTGRVPLEPELREAHGKGVVEEQAADEGLAHAEEDLERLGRLDEADDPREDPEDSPLGAARDEPRGGRLRVEAPVAGALVGPEDARLALEPEDGAVDVGLLQEVAGVVREVPGLEVVRSVDDHVVFLEDREGVSRVEGDLVGLDVHEGVQGRKVAPGALDLGLPDPGGVVEDLALQVALVDDVEVEEPEAPDPRGGEVERRGRPEATGSDQEDAPRLDLLLTLDRHLRHDEVTRIALDLRARELDPARDRGDDRHPVTVLHRRLQALQVAHVVSVHEDVHEVPERSILALQLRREARAFGEKGVEGAFEGPGRNGHLGAVPREPSKRRRNLDGDGHHGSFGEVSVERRSSRNPSPSTSQAVRAAARPVSTAMTRVRSPSQA